MKKLIKRTAAIVVIVILTLLIAVSAGMYFFANNAIRTYVEATATKKLNVPVDIGDLDISPFAGALELNKLTIANPSGYEHEYLLKIGQINTDVDLMSLRSDTVEINNLVFQNIEVVIEQKGLSTNLQEILKSVEKPKEEPKKEKKHFIIDNLEINDIKVKAKVLPVPGKVDTITFNPKPIKMTDLGKDDKLTMDELAKIIVEAIAADITMTGADILPNEVIEPMQDLLGDTPEKIFDTGEGILEGSKEAIEDIFK